MNSAFTFEKSSVKTKTKTKTAAYSRNPLESGRCFGGDHSSGFIAANARSSDQLNHRKLFEISFAIGVGAPGSAGDEDDGDEKSCNYDDRESHAASNSHRHHFRAIRIYVCNYLRSQLWSVEVVEETVI